LRDWHAFSFYHFDSLRIDYLISSLDYGAAIKSLNLDGFGEQSIFKRDLIVIDQVVILPAVVLMLCLGELYDHSARKMTL
jgi:hypothetical protein